MATTRLRKVEKTSTVRIGRDLMVAIQDACKNPRTTPPQKFGQLLEPWVVKLLKAAVRSVGAGKITGVTQQDSCRRESTIRLPRDQVKRLGVVSSITGRSVSEMIEEKLWELLDTK